MQKEIPERWLSKWKSCKWFRSEIRRGWDRFKCIRCPILCNSPWWWTLFQEQRRGLWLKRTHSGALGRKGAARQPAGPWGQRLPDGVRPAAAAAQERRTGAGLVHQDARKRPRCPLSPLSRAPRKRWGGPIFTLSEYTDFLMSSQLLYQPMVRVLLTIFLMDI